MRWKIITRLKKAFVIAKLYENDINDKYSCAMTGPIKLSSVSKKNLNSNENQIFMLYAVQSNYLIAFLKANFFIIFTVVKDSENCITQFIA